MTVARRTKRTTPDDPSANPVPDAASQLERSDGRPLGRSKLGPRHQPVARLGLELCPVPPRRPVPPSRFAARPPRPLEPILVPKLRIPFCRLPLPTLFYRPEAVHLGDLLRIWVRRSARFHRSASLGFSRAGDRTRDSARAAELCGNIAVAPSLGANPFQAACDLTKKRELFPGLTTSPPDRSRYRAWTRKPRPRSRRLRSGILTGFPFAHSGDM